MAPARPLSSSHNSYRDATSPLLSPVLKSSLPLPKALRENRSFANLARLLGIAETDRQRDGASSPDEDDGQVEEEISDDVDEESLMWDAQTALIAHQPAMAIQYYTLAALPPHRSAPACLALGNLLARGSSLLQTDTPTSSHKSRESRSSDQSDKTVTNDKSTAARIRGIFFSPPTSPPEPSSTTLPVKPVAVGWGIPRLGNRAVRDAEGMGVASGWLVLGLGWIVEAQSAKPIQAALLHTTLASEDVHDGDDDDHGIVLTSKNGRHAAAPNSQPDLVRQTSPDLSQTSSDHTDSTVLKTPYTEEGPTRTGVATPKPGRSEYEELKLIYDLLTPLVALYRHGQIQEHDPVSLPPITAAQLPSCLQPQGDLQKRRNVWQLGSVVVDALMRSSIVKAKSTSKGKGKALDKLEKRRIGVAVMANYILGMTRTAPETYFRQIVSLGQCGLDKSDELVEQAAARLDIILRSTPSPTSPAAARGEYPFPQMSASSKVGKGHSRMSSLASTQSMMSTISRRILPSMKSTASLASMASDTHGRPVAHDRSRNLPTPTNESLAMDSLRRIRASSARPVDVVNGTWWPSISIWSMRSAADPSDVQQATSTTTTIAASSSSLHHQASTSLTTGRPPAQTKPCIRTIASSPTVNLGFPRLEPSPSGQSTPRRRLPFEPSDTDSINTIDPELAAAELRSALTKQVICGVCSAKGVNFPNCRKCGLTFCSRTCRVDERKAGDGKRHVCGAWESRKYLTVPSPMPRSRRKSVGRPSPLTIKA